MIKPYFSCKASYFMGWGQV